MGKGKGRERKGKEWLGREEKRVKKTKDGQKVGNRAKDEKGKDGEEGKARGGWEFKGRERKVR